MLFHNGLMKLRKLAQTIKIGDEVEAKVIPGTSKDDFIRLSKIKAEQDAAWNYVADLAEGEKTSCYCKKFCGLLKTK